MPIMIQNNKTKLMCGGSKIAKMYCQGDVIYSSGNIVTYHVDTGVSHMEEVDEGVSCLSPKTFTPQKSGWTFVGWREDAAANGTVLSSKVMADDPIVLYAVFRQQITLSYAGNGNTGGATAAQTEQRYYNNGNVANPSFVLRTNGFSRSCYTFTKWALNSAGGTQYAAGSSITLSANTTMYATWTYVGAPFHIVQGQVCKMALKWPTKTASNIRPAMVGPNNWNVGDYSPGLASGDYSQTSNSSFTITSESIATNGNHTLEIATSASNAGGSIKVNGVVKTYKANEPPTFTFDISNASSIQIEVTCHAYPYNAPGCVLYTLRLY